MYFRDSSFECFNRSRATHNYRRWQQIPVRYCTREKRFLSLLSLTRRDNERWGMHVPWLSQGWLKSVCFSNTYAFVCYSQGRIQWEARTRRPRRPPPPPKIGKNMIFLHKIVIFHTKYPKNVRASLRSAQFFYVRPPPPP